MNNIVLVICVMCLVSCHEPVTFYEKVNRAPKITYSLQPTGVKRLVDSLKISSTQRSDYLVDMTVLDPDNNLAFVDYILTGGKVNAVATRGNDLKTMRGIGNGFYGYRINTQVLGTHKMYFVAVDKVGMSDTVYLDLVTFHNLPPVAALLIRPVRILSAFDYSFDASGSYDRDEKYGGKIELYEFSVNGILIDSMNPEIRYVFGGSQIVSIGLRVRDNDGVWSPRTSQIINVN